MSVDKVRKYFLDMGVSPEIREFDVSSATVELAAKAVGVEGARIAKTISLHSGEGCMIIVLAGDMKIDNQKFKHRFSMKARMLSHDEALEFTGHAVGGVCPFALPEGIPVYLDESLKRFDTVYPAAGSAASAVCLTPDELCAYSKGEWVDIAKPIEEAKAE